MSSTDESSSFIFDPEALLHERESTFLRRAVEQFTFLVEHRHSKYDKLPGDEFAKKATSAMDDIDKALARTRACSSAPLEDRRKMRNAFHVFVYKTVYPKWINNALQQKDNQFAAQAEKAFPVLDASFKEEVFTKLLRHDDFPHAIGWMLKFEEINSPENKLRILDKCTSVILKCMQDIGAEVTSDTLISSYILLMFRARLRKMASTLAFIDDFYDVRCRDGKLFCTYINLCCASVYLEDFKPYSQIVKTDLFDKPMPHMLDGRVLPDEYEKLLTPLRDLVRANRKTKERRPSVSVVPLAVSVGMYSMSSGISTSGGGKERDGMLSRALSSTKRKVYAQLMDILDFINTVLSPRAIQLVNPMLTNRLKNISELHLMQSIEWVVCSFITDAGPEGQTPGGDLPDASEPVEIEYREDEGLLSRTESAACIGSINGDLTESQPLLARSESCVQPTKSKKHFKRRVNLDL